MRRFVLAAVMFGAASGAWAADMPDLPVLRGSLPGGLSAAKANWDGWYAGGQLDYYSAECPSADNLRLVRRFEKGGSGSSGLEFKRPAADAASGGLRWLHA
jgi:hypothetical protein